MTAIVITDRSTREEIAAVIADLRERAKRYSLTDPKRVRLDEQCDALVEDWLKASDGGPEVPDA